MRRMGSCCARAANGHAAAPANAVTRWSRRLIRSTSARAFELEHQSGRADSASCRDAAWRSPLQAGARFSLSHRRLEATSRRWGDATPRVLQ